MTDVTSDPAAFAPGESCPAHVDVEAYLTDPASELDRCAHAHWYAEGLGMQGEPMPWVLSHEGVRSALRDRRLSPRSFPADMRAQGIADATVAQLTPLFSRDGDAHRQQRGLLSAAFTPRNVELLRPVSAEVARRLADGFGPDGTCDFMADFAALLPPEVFAALFGLPAEDRDELAALAAHVVQAFLPSLTAEQITQIERAAARLGEYCTDLIALRRAEPADDLTTHLLEVEVDGQRLEDLDIVATMSGFIFAGSETTKLQLAHMMLAFVDEPASWERLAVDPALIPGAVEEVLRTRGIIPALSRVAAEDFDHEDLEVLTDERLLVAVQAANHDDTHFEAPHVFDIERPNAADHVTFGWGPHFCLGAGLARIELQEALQVLVSRFGPPSVIGERPSTDVTAGAIDALPLRFPPRG